MLQVPRDIQVAFDRKIEEALVKREERPTYRKWLRFYLDFCSKYRHPPDSKGSLLRFLSKLASKNQSAERQAQAARSVGFYYDLVAKQAPELELRGGQPAAREEAGQYSRPARSTQVHSQKADEREKPEGAMRGPEGIRPAKPSSSDRRGVESTEEAQRGGRVSGNGNPMHRGHVASASFEEDFVGGRASWVPQYEGIEGAIRMRNYSPKTLASYRLWMRKFQSFVRSKPVDELDGEDAKAFLTGLGGPGGCCGLDTGSLPARGRESHRGPRPAMLSHSRFVAWERPASAPNRAMMSMTMRRCGWLAARSFSTRSS
jgi:hypothetical protein